MRPSTIVYGIVLRQICDLSVHTPLSRYPAARNFGASSGRSDLPSTTLYTTTGFPHRLADELAGAKRRDAKQHSEPAKPGESQPGLR